LWLAALCNEGFAVTLQLAEEKKQARVAAAKVRALAHAAGERDAAWKLAALEFPVVPQLSGSIVSAFHPYKSEINTIPILGKLAGEGWTTCLPIVIGPDLPLLFRRWLPGEPLVSGTWGIQRPSDDAPEFDPDVLLVPMLAFDRAGYRLGYGGGFYDRSLAKLRAIKPIIAIGVAYAAQEVDAVPHGAFDQPLDYVMTERDVITVRR
jgi:5-formyltetrahydrofolate cyclo-ligase